MELALEIENLSKDFGGGRTLFRTQPSLLAVDDISFSLARGETLALVGESGCGKSTTARLVLRLLSATSGKIYLNGRSMMEMSENDLHMVRRKLQIVFQDPYDSLNPRLLVRQLIAEPLQQHGVVPPHETKEEVARLLEMVGLRAEHGERYPHEFSGGQRQRIGIARALASRPDIVVCDEAVSALDVSVQAQIINLLKDLQSQLGVSYLFIAHDLSVVRQIADRIAVMYLGQIIEIGSNNDLFRQASHPYTQALLRAIPLPEPSHEKQAEAISGELPSPLNPPPGCPFHPRCPFATDICHQKEPQRENIADNHEVACHHWEEVFQTSQKKPPLPESRSISLHRKKLENLFEAHAN